MNYSCYSLLSESPRGFRRGIPTRHDILAAPLAVLAPTIEQALATLGSLKDRADALLLAPADRFEHEIVAPRLHALKVKHAMLPDAQALAQSYLAIMADGNRLRTHCRKLEAELDTRRHEASSARTSYDQNLTQLSHLEYQIADSCETIRHSEYEKAFIMDNVSERIAFHDRERRIIWANRAYLKGVATITGKPATVDSVKGMRCHELLCRKGFCNECPVELSLRSGYPREAEMSPQNQPHWPATQGSFLVRSAPARDSAGNVIGAIEMMIDITEKKRTEALQQRLQTIERLGQLAGGIAHDFNNLLMGLFGNIEIAILQLPAEHEAQVALQDAHQALDQTRRITTRLLTFAKGGNPVIETVDIRRDIPDTVRFNLAGSNVAAKFEISEDLWSVNADKGQLGEVVANLTVNAREAMPAGGTLHVRAENVSGNSENFASERCEGMIKLTFKDEGIGIPARLQERVFEPYFSTKQRGSGLGLAVVHSIVIRHKGHIEVESSPGNGTTFTVFLPAGVETRMPAATEIAPDADPSSCASLRILLMDDEKTVQVAASRMLGKLGHTVEIAADGREAIAKYKIAMTHGKPFDVTIIDLTIPGGMGGKAAIKELRKIDPSVKALVFSGYASDPVMACFMDYGFSGRLEKPLTMRELKREISRLSYPRKT